MCFPKKKKNLFKKVYALLLNGNQMCKCDRNVQAPCKIRAGLNYSTWAYLRIKACISLDVSWKDVFGNQHTTWYLQRGSKPTQLIPSTWGI